MLDPRSDPQLVSAVSDFTDELNTLIAGVIPGASEPFVANVTAGASTLVLISQSPAKGIPLSVDGSPLLRLTASFGCAWDHAHEFLAVRRSQLGLYAEGSAEPLFRYDFDADGDGKIPSAHLNVHGHRDEIVFTLMSAGRRYRGRSRSSSIARGEIPKLATFHFPLGGHRFRPSLEDVLEIAVREFGVTTLPHWEDAVRAGRASWRDKQLRAAVRDDPECAADALRHLGYSVDWPADRPRPTRRDERVLAL